MHGWVSICIFTFSAHRNNSNKNLLVNWQILKFKIFSQKFHQVHSPLCLSFLKNNCVDQLMIDNTKRTTDLFPLKVPRIFTEMKYKLKWKLNCINLKHLQICHKNKILREESFVFNSDFDFNSHFQFQLLLRFQLYFDFNSDSD